MQIRLKLNEHEYKAKLVKRAYSNGNVAIQAIDPENGETIAILSVNTGDSVVSDPEYFLKSGYVTIPVCKLIKEL